MESLLKALENELLTVKNMNAFDQVKAKFLGKNSWLKKEYQHLKTISPEKRPGFAQKLNLVKQQIEELLSKARTSLEDELLRQKSGESIDRSLPGFPLEVGNLHPLTLIEEKCSSCLRRLGFKKVSGPEVETPFYNFDALCIPKHHPARDAQDTFWLSNDYLMRSHTTTVQARVLSQCSEKDLPIKIISPGRVYRNETVDATHLACFHQFEGLYVDKNVKLSHLKWTLIYLLKELYGQNRKIRFKPKFYPYTEPSIGADISCDQCDTKGCDKCHGAGWITIVGAGMVHPNLLKNLGYSDKITGFAFGFGLSRLATQFYPIGLRPLYGVNTALFKELLGKIV